MSNNQMKRQKRTMNIFFAIIAFSFMRQAYACDMPPADDLRENVKKVHALYTPFALEVMSKHAQLASTHGLSYAQFYVQGIDSDVIHEVRQNVKFECEKAGYFFTFEETEGPAIAGDMAFKIKAITHDEMFPAGSLKAERWSIDWE